MIKRLIEISGRDYDEEIIRYGMTAIFNGIVSITIMLILGAINKKILESAIYLLSNLMIYTQVGGYHAKTRLGCIVLTVINWKISVSYFEIWTNAPKEIWIMAFIVNFIILWICAPVLHPNKARFGEKVTMQQKIKAIVRVLLGYIVIIIFWNLNEQDYAGILMMSISEIVIFMLIGKGVYKRYEEQEIS